MTDQTRVVIISPWHPELSNGGAQTASYALFSRLKACKGVVPIYVARSPTDLLGHAGAFAAFRGRPDEILWAPPGTDDFRLVTRAPGVLRRQTKGLIASLAPDLVHLHHYAGFGTDLIRMLKLDFGLPVVLTLHEFQAICHRHGQMLKTNGQLCYTASHAECAACFPDRTSGKFFLRKTLITENLSYVDRFVAPSKFLAERYAAWGIDRNRIRVIENPMREAGGAKVATRAGDGTLRIGYFGRLTPYKGIDVLLDAVGFLDQEVKQKLKLSLFGFNLDTEASDFERGIAAKIDALKDCVIHRGPYRNEDAIELMQSVDWVVVPSVWWENSPVVIQEAKVAGVPVLCASIGGMREKVRPGADGVHFVAGDRADLASRITAICRGEVLLDGERSSAEPSSALQELLDLYLQLAVNSNARDNFTETL